MTESTQTTTDEWVFPFEQVLEAHRARIDGNEDMVPLVVEGWYIGGEHAQWMVSTVGCGQEITTRDAGLHALKLMAAASGCDYAVIAFDSHATSLRNNPVTGRPWGPGEMQAMCDEQGFGETGQMVDVLQIAVVRRSDSKIRMTGIPYHFHKGELILYDTMPAGVPVEFNEWNSGETQYEEMGGLIPNAMREAMASPTLGSYRSPERDSSVSRIEDIMTGLGLLGKVADSIGEPDLFAMMAAGSTEAEVQYMSRLEEARAAAFGAASASDPEDKSATESTPAP